MDNIELLNYAKEGSYSKQAWIGGLPQFNMDIIDLEGSTNYRVAQKFHGQYDLVWVCEKPLNDYHCLSWKIILDEAVRLLKQIGKLVVKFRQTTHFTTPMLKSFLGRNINLDVKLDYEYNDKDYYNIVFVITRLNFEIYHAKTWTFAMLTNGQKDDVVLKFLESIRNNELSKSQIIISGPKKEIYDKYDVEYLDLSKYRDDKYAEISRKKNDIVKMAKGANILIAHDRYFLDNNFFIDFENYGYDFDFLAIRQKSITSKKDFPSYCYTYGLNLSWSHPGVNTCLNQLPESTYINGGLMVFKTNTIKQIGFNNLLFWNQQEDVEITRKFQECSIIPRVNFIASAYTTRDANEYPFDVYDGKKIHYKCDMTRKTRPSFYGVTWNKHRYTSIKLYLKTKFPFLVYVWRFLHLSKV